MASPETDRNPSKQLADVLRAEIEAGSYPPGSKIPSYRQLRDAHHVALNTAQAAIRLLAAEGLVEIRPAQGVYVREHRGRHGPDFARRAPTYRRPCAGAGDLTAAEKALAGLLARLPSEDKTLVIRRASAGRLAPATCADRQSLMPSGCRHGGRPAMRRECSHSAIAVQEGSKTVRT